MASSHLGHYFQPPSSFQSVLEEDKEVTIMPSTKLACTLGPQSRDVSTLEELLKAGMTMARFDFSYGDVAYHQQTLDNLHQAMASTRKLCATMIDTVGPEIFVSNRSNSDPIVIKAGQTIVLTSDQSLPASSEVLPISYATLDGSAIQPGASIFVGQYLFTGSEESSVYLTVLEVDGQRLVCKSENGCVLEGLQLTVHFANMKNNAPILTEADKNAIRTFGRTNKVDFISLAFCRTAQDVYDCRELLDNVGLHNTQIVGKIENMEGLVNFVDILSASDALIFSRGNLGICLDAEKVFLCQKMLLRACNLAGKPVFVTRVVDTMTDAPRPTRAEATDVANLVLDGADGILLGSETFRGRYPVGTAKTVMAICKQAELCFDSEAFYRTLMDFEGANSAYPDMGKTEALASSAVRAAAKINAKLLVVFTVTGRTARMVAKYKPSQPILTVVCKDAVSAQHNNDDVYSKFFVNEGQKHDGAMQSQVVVPSIVQNGLKWTWTGDFQARQCLCYRGVLPIMADPTIGSPGGAILDYAIAYARHKGLVKTGDRVVVSQCPRKSSSDVMEEAGVVKLITIDDDACGAISAYGVEPATKQLTAEAINPVYLIGSMDNLALLGKHHSTGMNGI